uniref:Putative secreted protein n=1 Tax=Ixodes ricinus TaxID=34613 RepID=A0A6B0TW80_IXORI
MSLEARMVSLAAICFILLRWSITGRYFSSLVLLAWTRASFRFSKDCGSIASLHAHPGGTTRSRGFPKQETTFISIRGMVC